MNFSALLIAQLERFVRFVNQVFMDAPRLREFFDVLDTEPAVRDRRDAVDPGRLRGMVEFSDVSFSYDGKRAAVADLTFTALPGETVALVGATGAGKSTALALLHRAFDPQSGTVKIDGMDIRGAQARGAAPQHRRGVPGGAAVQPLDRREPAASASRTRPRPRCATPARARRRSTSSSAIRTASPAASASAAARCRAASASGCRSRARCSRTRRCSSSTRRRARSTPRTEAKVQAALDEVMKHRTTFVIAHRLATVRNATRILVFDQGRIIESGSFDELVAKNGRFAELARAQFMVGGGARAARLALPAPANADVEAPESSRPARLPGEAGDHMSDGDPHEQIAQLEAQIEALAETVEGCRKIMLVAKVAMAGGATAGPGHGAGSDPDRISPA